VAWAIVLALLTISPPFIYTYKTDVMEFVGKRTWGFLFYPPVDERGRGMEIDLKTLFVEILFASICFVGIIIGTNKYRKKIQGKLPEVTPDPLKEELEQYGLKTKQLILKKGVLDFLAIYFLNPIDSEKSLVSSIESSPNTLIARFLLNFKKRRTFFFETMNKDEVRSNIINVKNNIIKEYSKLIGAFEDIFPITKELEEIHEKRVELFKLNFQLIKVILKEGKEGWSNWKKDHPDFFEELVKNDRGFRNIFSHKEISYNIIALIDNEEEQKIFVANFIWNNVFERVGECPVDLLYY
jgi:hypothetical protein